LGFTSSAAFFQSLLFDSAIMIFLLVEGDGSAWTETSPVLKYRLRAPLSERQKHSGGVFPHAGGGDGKPPGGKWLILFREFGRRK